MRRPSLIFLFIIFCTGSVFAADPPRTTSKKSKATATRTTKKRVVRRRKAPPPPPKEEEGFFQKTLLKTSDFGAKTIDTMSNKLDMMLAGEKTTNKKTTSKLILRNDFYSLEGRKQIDYKLRADVRLNLPNLEEKWTLNFTSYDDDEDERGIQRNRLKTAPRPENYGASVMLLKKLGDIDFTFRPKLQLVDKRIVTSHLLRFESEADMKTYKILPRLELFAKASTGTGQLFAINFEYMVNDKFVLALINEEEYVDFENTFSTNHELALLQSLSKSKSLKYATLFESSSEPDNFHLTQYTFYLSYKHMLYKDKLHYAVSPRLIFPESTGYSHLLALVLNIDFIF